MHDRHAEALAGRASRAASPSGPRRRCRSSRACAAGRRGRRRPSSRAARRRRTRRATLRVAGESMSSAIASASARRPSSSELPVHRELDQVERAVRRARRAVDGVVDLRAPRLRSALLDVPVLRRGALERRLDELERERDRLVDELDGLEQPVGEPELERLPRVEQPVLPQRVDDDEADRASRRRRGAARAACRPSRG